MRSFIAVMLAGLCAACTDTGRTFPLDDASLAAGIPKFQFVRQGLNRGPVTVTMPDGEVLTGEYQVTDNAAVGIGFAGGHTATAIGFGSGRPVAVNAVGNRGTIMTCDGAIDIGGHGSLVCQTNHGTKYRIMV